MNDTKAKNSENDKTKVEPEKPLQKVSRFGNPQSFRNQNLGKKEDQVKVRNTGPAMRHKV